MRIPNNLLHPNWNSPVDVLVTRKTSPGNRTTLECIKDIHTDGYMYSLVATFEITGGNVRFTERLGETPAQRLQNNLDANRTAAWYNALKLAEMLAKASTYQSYMVRFCPKKSVIQPEVIRVYSKLQTTLQG